MVDLKVFTMDGCSHCVQLKNHLKELDIAHKVYSVNEPKDKPLVEKFGVTNFPTIFFVEDNKIIDVQVGFNPQAQNMREVLESYEARNR